MAYLEEMSDSVMLLQLRAEHMSTLYTYMDKTCQDDSQKVASSSRVLKGRNILKDAGINLY